jgi:hypothetical protein
LGQSDFFGAISSPSRAIGIWKSLFHIAQIVNLDRSQEAKIWSQVSNLADELMSQLDSMGDLITQMRAALSGLDDIACAGIR